MFKSTCFRLDWWVPLLQNFIPSLLCYFTHTEKRIFQLQIACHTFLCLPQPRPLWNWLMETRDMPKELGLFYASFLIVTLFIQWDQFIIFLVTLPTPSHQVPWNFMLSFKRLCLNLLNIVNLLIFKVVLNNYLNRLKTVSTIFKSKFSNSTVRETGILFSQLSMHLKKYLSDYSSSFWSCLYYQTKTNFKKRTHRGSTRNIPGLEEPWPIFLLTKETKIPRSTTIYV